MRLYSHSLIRPYGVEYFGVGWFRIDWSIGWVTVGTGRVGCGRRSLRVGSRLDLRVVEVVAEPTPHDPKEESNLAVLGILFENGLEQTHDTMRGLV